MVPEGGDALLLAQAIPWMEGLADLRTPMRRPGQICVVMVKMCACMFVCVAMDGGGLQARVCRRVGLVKYMQLLHRAILMLALNMCVYVFVCVHEWRGLQACVRPRVGLVTYVL